MSRGSSETAQNRISRELVELQKHGGSEFWEIHPVIPEDLFKWHFTVRGPDETDFEGGCYHGVIQLPGDYPLSPPSFILLTPNGRFEIGQKICLSASNFHPELWQPAWGLRSMMNALQPFFATPADGAVHALDWSSAVRRRLAARSGEWTCNTCAVPNRALLDTYCIKSPLSLNRPSRPPEGDAKLSGKYAVTEVAGQKKEGAEATLSKDAGMASGQFTEGQSSDVANSMPALDSAALSLEERRRLRTRPTAVGAVLGPSLSTNGPVLVQVIAILITRPLATLLLGDLLQRDLPRVKKVSIVLDRLLVIMGIYIMFLLADLVRHPPDVIIAIFR